MKDLIDDLLEFSRLNTDVREFELVIMEIALEDVLRNLEPTIKENKAQITHDYLPNIIGDPCSDYPTATKFNRKCYQIQR